MVNGFTIVMDREKMDMDLLLTANPSLPEVVRNLNTCYPFAGIVGNKTVSVCLMEKKEHFYDIVNLAVHTAFQGKGLSKEMLLYALDYVRAQGGRYVEIGCGNANVKLFTMFQKVGFRVVGVWPDYFMYDNRIATVEGSILNRDMIRFRVDLYDKNLTNI